MIYFLTKEGLHMNQWNRIVSLDKHVTAKKEMRSVKHALIENNIILGKKIRTPPRLIPLYLAASTSSSRSTAYLDNTNTRGFSR
jgi:hypothetical protein